MIAWWKFIGSLGLILIGFAGFTIWAGYFDGWLMFGSFYFTALGLAGTFVVMMLKQKEEEMTEERQKERRTFKYCWTKTNEQLRRFAGGNQMLWNDAFGQRSEVRTYSDGKKSVAFRALYGRMSKTYQMVIVIFNIDKEDIARFYTNPPAHIINNPFSEFKPFELLGLNYPGQGRPYKNQKGKVPSLSIHYGDNEENTDPDPEYIQQALNSYRGQEDSKDDD